ncbi:HGxxPAAW family protein [Actinopolymorpha alba]|uniref:HGxxPAAW family protein n=1 Tax=Actinopolymorpha alba TaxID=533267 RepID=UPI00037DC073|nr:HGxxPAAW family protein [Actinopolymorpha alba]
MANNQGGGSAHTVHHGHGNSPAAWTAVAIILVGSVIAGVAVVLATWWLFFVAAIGIPIIGLIVGKIMVGMGLGNTPVQGHSRAELDAAAAKTSQESVEAS